jgi:hypothetical protein
MKEIKAREGYYLTQVGNVGSERVYITALKGANINEEDWREATEEEKNTFEEAMRAEEEAKRMEEENNLNN